MNKSLVYYASGVWKMCKFLVTQVMKMTHVWQNLTCYLKDVIFRQFSVFIAIRFPECIGFSTKIGKSKNDLKTSFKDLGVYQLVFWWENLLVLLCRVISSTWSLGHFKGQFPVLICRATKSFLILSVLQSFTCYCLSKCNLQSSKLK